MYQLQRILVATDRADNAPKTLGVAVAARYDADLFVGYVKRGGGADRYGTAATKIVKAAAECRSDVIVMGTPVKGRVKALVGATDFDRVLKKASCAVLAVKPDGYPFLKE